MATPKSIIDSVRRPLLGAVFAVWKDGRVLLAQRDNLPFEGAWSLPGGTVEAGETIEQAALRELEEETGVVAKPIGLATYLDVIGRSDDGALKHHFVVVVLAGLYESGSPYAGDGTKAVDWVIPAEVASRRTTDNLGHAIEAAHAVYLRHLLETS